jgi:hypothetical protein
LVPNQALHNHIRYATYGYAPLFVQPNTNPAAYIHNTLPPSGSSNRLVCRFIQMDENVIGVAKVGSLEQISGLLRSHKKDEKSTLPLMNVAAAREELLKWLSDLKLPSDSSAKSWDELIQVFPALPSEQQETSGVKMRLALRLFTAENTYLISIMECLERDSRGVYLISVHVNWRVQERQVQKMVEESYRGQFDDTLRAKHALWAQTYRTREFPDALSACFKAILSHELKAGHEPNESATPLNPVQPAVVSFPKAEES